MPDKDCCGCKPLLCGPHIIRPCRVDMLQQVNGKGKDTLFIVRMVGLGQQAIFITLDEARPLLDHWGIESRKVPKIFSGSRPRSSSYQGNSSDGPGGVDAPW